MDRVMKFLNGPHFGDMRYIPLPFVVFILGKVGVSTGPRIAIQSMTSPSVSDSPNWKENPGERLAICSGLRSIY